MPQAESRGTKDRRIAERRTADRIRSLRPPKAPVDPWRPIDVLVETERRPGGGRVPTVTVFLAGAECPFTCVFCDLWRHTLDGPTPAGAIPAQLRRALADSAGELEGAEEAWIKLYNASNYFEPRAVPPADDPEIAELLRPFAGTVVECHPRLVGRRCFELAERLEGRLQVAVGLETVHPEALARLNKGLDLATFDRAAADLAERGIELRAFVLVGAPFVPPAETVAWTVQSAAYAFERGAVHVTLIPVRGGNGELDRLAEQGLFTPPTLDQVEEALDRSLAVAGDRVVTVDGWDLERLEGCPRCRGERIARLERINLGGAPEAPVDCPGGCSAG
jgi:hypothetical protein